MNPFAYMTPNPAPADYVCSKCGAQGCKLWRQYNTFSDHIRLLCVDCAGANQKTSVLSVGEDGRRRSRYGNTDQIGYLIPAVPTEDGETFWGYTSVPEAGAAWWRALPTRAR